MPTPLSIALDATLWDEPTTGIGLYTHRLTQALEEEGVRVRRIGARLSGENPRGQRSPSAFAIAKLPSLLRTLDEPLYHGVCNFTLPLRRVPGKRMVLTVHDTIPILMPDTVSTLFRWQFRLWLSRSLQVADRVICNSLRTRQDLTSQFKVLDQKLEVVPLGVDHVDSIAPPDSLGLAYLRGLVLPPQYVLYAGAIDVRKNISRLLDAMEYLQQRGEPVPLVLVGQPWFKSNPVEKRISAMRERGFDIRILGYQPSSIFYELMRRATVFAFPSRYEGFGLPPLEAMHLGIPVVTSTAGALPETCGDAAVQVDPEDSEGLANALIRLLKSPEERSARNAAGRRWAARYTWRNAARRTIEVYRAALDELR